jgi:hypothetical protein
LIYASGKNDNIFRYIREFTKIKTNIDLFTVVISSYPILTDYFYEDGLEQKLNICELFNFDKYCEVMTMCQQYNLKLLKITTHNYFKILQKINNQDVWTFYSNYIEVDDNLINQIILNKLFTALVFIIDRFKIDILKYDYEFLDIIHNVEDIDDLMKFFDPLKFHSEHFNYMLKMKMFKKMNRIFKSNNIIEYCQHIFNLCKTTPILCRDAWLFAFNNGIKIDHNILHNGSNIEVFKNVIELNDVNTTTLLYEMRINMGLFTVIDKLCNERCIISKCEINEESKYVVCKNGHYYDLDMFKNYIENMDVIKCCYCSDTMIDNIFCNK